MEDWCIVHETVVDNADHEESRAVVAAASAAVQIGRLLTTHLSRWNQVLGQKWKVDLLRGKIWKQTCRAWQMSQSDTFYS